MINWPAIAIIFLVIALTIAWSKGGLTKLGKLGKKPPPFKIRVFAGDILVAECESLQQAITVATDLEKEHNGPVSIKTPSGLTYDPHEWKLIRDLRMN